MNKIPILRIKDTLIVSLQDDLTDKDAVQFQNNLLEKIYSTKTKGVLIDISLLDIVDSFLGKILSDTSKMIKLLGTKLVLVGMTPSVAITLVELDLQIDGIITALNIDQGLEKLDILAKFEEIDYYEPDEVVQNDSM
jgi:rsbT antagonist protein RsbS